MDNNPETQVSHLPYYGMHFQMPVQPVEINEVNLSFRNNQVEQFGVTMTAHVFYGFMNYYNTKENLYVTAIRNYIRGNNFAELYNELKSSSITKEQYDEELKNNPDKYIITINKLNNPSDAFVISDIVKKIGFDLRELTTGEVSEMFSVNEEQLILQFPSNP